MSKYDSLGEYLLKSQKNTVSLSFKQIEDIVGFELSKYLKTYAAAWYGTAEGSPSHVQKAAWCSVGYQVDTLNLPSQTVTFKKI